MRDIGQRRGLIRDHRMRGMRRSWSQGKKERKSRYLRRIRDR
jgi:hypothetical protein